MEREAVWDYDFGIDYLGFLRCFFLNAEDAEELNALSLALFFLRIFLILVSAKHSIECMERWTDLGFLRSLRCVKRLKILRLYLFGWGYWITCLVGDIGWFVWLDILDDLFGWRYWITCLVGDIGWLVWLEILDDLFVWLLVCIILFLDLFLIFGFFGGDLWWGILGELASK